MTDDLAEMDEMAPAVGVGAELKAAREERGLTIEQLAAETRIPQRHLQTIELGDFAALPARTYAIGFARTYARVVGLSDVEVAEKVRAELDAQEPEPRERSPGFEPGDPARVPSRSLGWLSILAAILVIAGIFFAFRTFFAPAAELPSLVEQEQAEAQAPATPQREANGGEQAATAARSDGAVVFTALDGPLWVKFYDASGRQLMQKEMSRGESYEVPGDAQGPQLWTARPDALAITVGGRAIPKLSDRERIMRDVPVTADALLARTAPAPGQPSGVAASLTSPTN